MASFLECSTDDDKSDDGVNVYNGVWGDMSTTILIYGSIGFALLAVFEYSRSNKAVYACGRANFELPAGFLKWLVPLIKINKQDVLHIAGMDGFVLIRFLSQCLKISSFCLLLSLLVLFPTYSSGASEMRNTFGKTTMDHLGTGSAKLWIPFFVNYAITFFVIYCVKMEWDLYVNSRVEFLKWGDQHVPEVAKFTVRVESIPLELRSDDKLRGYFDEIFPDMVTGAVIQLKSTAKIEAGIQEAEVICINLEYAQAKKQTEYKLWHQLRDQCIVEHPPKEPKVYVSSKRLKALRSSSYASSVATSSTQLSPISNLNQKDIESRLEGGSSEENNIPFPPPNPNESASSDDLSLQSKQSSNNTAASSSSCLDVLGYKQVHAIPFYKSELDLKNFEVRKLQEEVKQQFQANASSTGFVTFKSRQAASDSISILLSNDLSCNMKLFDATDPRNIIWENIADELTDFEKRNYLISVAVKLFAVFLFIPLLIFCNVFGNIEQLSKLPGLSFLGGLKPGSFLYDFITGQLPPLLQATLVGALPAIFEYIATSIEKVKLISSVQRSVLDRGFGFQLVNIYFTLLGSSLASTIGYIISQPTCVFQLLGGSVPAVAVYFFQLILINSLFGLLMQLARPVPLLKTKFYHWQASKSGMSPIALQKFIQSEVVGFNGGSILPGILLVSVLGLTYSVMVPFFNLVSTLYFSIALLVFKYNILFVYSPTSESGGLLFPTLQNYLLTGLNFANATMMGYVFIKGGFYQFVLLSPSIIIVELFKGHIEQFYVKKAASIGRKEAVALDKSDADSFIAEESVTNSGGDKGLGGSNRGMHARMSTTREREELNSYRQPCLIHRSLESSVDKQRFSDMGDHAGVLSETQFQTAVSQHAF